MKLKTKIILFVLVGLSVLAGTGCFLRVTSRKEVTGHVITYGVSVCTQDIPSSDCGSYDVTVQTKDGKTHTYTVAGYSDRNSKMYDGLSSKITQAKAQQAQVTIKLNARGEVVAVERG